MPLLAYLTAFFKKRGHRMSYKLSDFLELIGRMNILSY
jgi:hypothetical protein